MGFRVRMGLPMKCAPANVVGSVIAKAIAGVRKTGLLLRKLH